MTQMYSLEKYKMGGSTKHTCPKCGRKKCFTLYKNTQTGKYLSDECGKCDHINSCGYHYTPKQYFADHPGSSDKTHPPQANKQPPQPKPQPLCTLPMSYVTRSLSLASEFADYLRVLLPADGSLKRVADMYMLGATRDHGVIYWQIDMEQRVRSGKIMHYGADGHRKGNPNWTHARLIYNRLLPYEWQLTPCFFGEHLLKDSQKPVCIVESEKTAVICAALHPKYTWIATGGCSMLKPEKCNVLKGRRVIVYPDSGKLDDWTKKMAQTEGIDYTMVTALEAYPGNTDIADLIVEETLPFPPIDFSRPPF